MPQRPAPRLPAHAGRNERLGRLAMLSIAVNWVLLTGALGLTARLVADDLLPYLEDAATAPPGELLPPPPASVVIGVLPLVAVALLAWIPIALLIAWSFRCATAAAALGIPATLEPLWAAIGWLIPALNYWYPYRAVRDCLPPEHPARGTVGWWWACWLAASYAPLVAGGLALAGTLAFVTAWAVVAGLAAITTTLALRIVRAIDEAHREALGAS